MGHLFLDIETYASEEDIESGINPYMPESKVILIAYNYYSEEKPPVKEQIKTPVILKEWESDEKTILSDFLVFLRNLQKQDTQLRIHGFNLMKFDLPYLFARMKFHELAEPHELHRILFKPIATDMMQLSYMLSDVLRNKEKLWNFSSLEVNKFFGLQEEEGTGDDYSRFYDAGEYEKIAKKCLDDFKFEQLMNAFYLYIQRLGEGKE